jgi:hypothetical protein
VMWMHVSLLGRYQCPVLNKEFTEHTHIVAVRPTGNVYCWEAGAPLSLTITVPVCLLPATLAACSAMACLLVSPGAVMHASSGHAPQSFIARTRQACVAVW